MKSTEKEVAKKQMPKIGELKSVNAFFFSCLFSKGDSWGVIFFLAMIFEKVVLLLAGAPWASCNFGKYEQTPSKKIHDQGNETSDSLCSPFCELQPDERVSDGRINTGTEQNHD